ncbi:MAG: metal-dependent hydrolase [Phycisphaerae bacterium]
MINFAEGNEMGGSITWFGHSTMRLALPDGRVIMIDPWLTDNPACPDDLKTVDRCDMIFLTHGHFDHIGDVGALVKAHNPVVVGNFELCAALTKTVGDANYSPMNTGGTQVVDGVRVSLTQALHSSGVDTPQGPMYAGMPNGLVIQADDVCSVYHAGDTDVFSDMALIKAIYQPTVAILPIGDLFTMGAKGAAIAADLLEPACVIPVHYKTFPILAQSADEFHAALSDGMKSRLLVADIGKPLTWDKDGVRG